MAAALASEIDATIHGAPPAAHELTAADLATLSRAPDGEATTPGTSLAAILLSRLPDYRANLLGVRFMNLAERETYVRQNIRTMRPEYAPPQLWRMLVRYLYEFQYLRFSAVVDKRTVFLGSTWFDADFLASGVMTDERFDALSRAVDRLCASYAVDEKWFRLPTD